MSNGRIEFSKKTKRAIVERSGGLCELCQAVLKPGEGEVDHILPCALGGEPTVANGRLLCRPCHKQKTANDVRSIRKIVRVSDKARGIKAPKPKIASRGFPKTDKQRPKKAELPRRPIYQEVAE